MGGFYRSRRPKGMHTPDVRPTASAQVAWEASCPPSLTHDLLWKLRVYRAALYLLHCAGEDAEMLQARGKAGIADQLHRAAASVSANLAEGYSRSGRADRIKFLDYALGSARECISWYQAGQSVLGERTVHERHELLSHIRGMLLGMIRSTRTRPGAPDFKR
jgi:four helix bundle protein